MKKNWKTLTWVVSWLLICTTYPLKANLFDSQSQLSLGSSYTKEPVKRYAKAENAKTQFVKSGNTNYAYRLIGKKSEVPVVMLQRFRGTMDDWDPAFINQLGEDRTVIVFNNAGVASSSGEVPTTIKGMADHVAQFVKALGYEQVDIAGWSMGGFVAQVVAIDYPELIWKVVLIGTGPAGGGSTFAPAPEEVFEVSGRPVYGEEEQQYLFFTDTPKGYRAMKASLKRIGDRRADQLEAPTTQTVMEQQTEAILSFWVKDEMNYYEALHNLKHPTLIVSGDRDVFFNMEAQVRLYQELPDAQMVIYPMAGHGAHHEYYDHATKVINDFL